MTNKALFNDVSYSSKNQMPHAQHEQYLSLEKRLRQVFLDRFISVVQRFYYFTGFHRLGCQHYCWNNKNDERETSTMHHKHDHERTSEERNLFMKCYFLAIYSPTTLQRTFFWLETGGNEKALIVWRLRLVCLLAIFG